MSKESASIPVAAGTVNASCNDNARVPMSVFDLTGRLLGETADIVDAAAFLAGDAARLIHGPGLAVNGGMGM
jgi:NAD(P)-dependent dehydrogenase (short-subunit alcohol dehydrogenase family)